MKSVNDNQLSLLSNIRKKKTIFYYFLYNLSGEELEGGNSDVYATKFTPILLYALQLTQDFGMLSQIFIFPFILEKLRKPHFSALSALQVKKGRHGYDEKPNNICNKALCFNIKSESAIIYKIIANVKKFASNYLYLILPTNPITNSIFQSDLIFKRGDTKCFTFTTAKTFLRDSPILNLWSAFIFH